MLAIPNLADTVLHIITVLSIIFYKYNLTDISRI